MQKKNGTSVCMCGDYTKLNDNVKRSNFPIPKVDVTLDNLKGSKHFSKLDTESGFYQIKLDKKSKKLTFITLFRQFMFTRLPFGINCAPNYFSQRFSKLFHDLDVTIHMDNVLIYTDTKEKHLELLDIIFKRLKKADITLDKIKCVFCVNKTEFLRHIILQKGIKSQEIRNFRIFKRSFKEGRATYMDRYSAASFSKNKKVINTNANISIL